MSSIRVLAKPCVGRQCLTVDISVEPLSNIKDHEVLKKARTVSRTPEDAARLRRRPHASSAFSDQQVEREMDVAAVEATRSYRTWHALPEGGEFVYNQKYVKGKEGHDWLLRKNIWRRMRYRRENKKLLAKLMNDPGGVLAAASGSGASGQPQPDQNQAPSAAQSVAAADASNADPGGEGPSSKRRKLKKEPTDRGEATASGGDHSEDSAAAAAQAAAEAEADQAAIEAAVAAAESFGKATGLVASSPGPSSGSANANNPNAAVQNPLDAAALDAAAKIAATAAVAQMYHRENDDKSAHAAAAAAEEMAIVEQV